ncbi:Heat induced stress protein YflT [Alkalibacterium subtropicum]|uniref:Heat induced stress protein YflT n=1 Tax=Alkalibacterium subtropicum TaxID=753702 RepID=A0A1I1FGR5_9LACT|nr:general stress protein [Alkalibacterium subtropicum]SFB96323.1 Heat induced stress protein YflT [Alkalibacterium subtropicum]
MKNQDQRVIGSYEDDKETKRIIRHLMDQGYRKDQLTIYTNEEKHHLFSEVENVQVAQPDTDTHENMDTPEEDKNFWESIRDAFHVREDHRFDDPSYKSENTLLKPYRDDLQKGRYIVAVDDSADRPRTDRREETPSNEEVAHAQNPPLETLGTTAGFPNEGSVQGMGDGGQPPVEPRSEDGTPPELEDTAAAADEQTATKDRLSQERHENRPNK